MKKNDQELLGSGQWYFVEVNIDQEKGKERIVIDELEYKTLIDGLNADGKFLKVGKNHYFLSKIDSFGPIEFETGVLTQIKELPEEQQNYIKLRIRKGYNITTLDNLRSEIAYFLSK